MRGIEGNSRILFVKPSWHWL